MGRIFSIDPKLYYMPFKFDIFLFIRNFLSHGNFELLLNKINSCQLFSHCMLHLNACIHFHEVEIKIFIQQKLNRTCRVIFGIFNNVHSRLTNFFAQFWRNTGLGDSSISFCLLR